MPYLINTDKANLGGKICFVFFAPSFFMCIFLYLYLPESKGRNYAELEEMFQAKVPAREFKNYVCQTANELSQAVQNAKGTELETK
jgi:MFS transporter, SP family, general alpha glucoside:H+ symporter